MSTERPLVSVVIETITARYDGETGERMADDLAPTLTALERQTYPPDRVETVVVVDSDVPLDSVEEVRRRFPFVTLAESGATNYCAAKNAGAKAARGSVVALIDGDCVPDPPWLERLVSRLGPGVAVVAGRTRYARASAQARALSVPGFGYVVGDEAGNASGINLNNAAFGRDVLVENPLDERIRRNGGCYFLYHQLRDAGKRMLYEPGAVVAHGVDDIRGVEFVRKHFGRGFDGVGVYRLDGRGLLRGTRVFKRYGAAGLAAITAHRIVRDWAWIARHRRQIGVADAAVPLFALVAVLIRSIELAGMIAAVVDPEHYDRRAARPSS